MAVPKQPQGRAVEVNVASLKSDFFVRTSLNEDHVVQLALLYEGGVDLPPIWISQQDEVIDGRHRIKAAELAGRVTIPALVLRETERTELMVLALRANVGGALPADQKDIVFTIEQLLNEGMSERQILDRFDFFPRQVTRVHITNAQGHIYKLKLQAAKNAVAVEGLTVAEAAREYKVDIEKLKEAITGVGAKRRTKNLQAIITDITRAYKSVGMRNAQMFRKLHQQLLDGDVSTDVVHKICDHTQRAQQNHARSLADWIKRLEAAEDQAAQALGEVGQHGVAVQ